MNQRNQNLSRVNIYDMMSKCQSKREIYNFLSREGEAYLPKLESTNIYFLKQIMRSEKDYVRRDEVNVAAVPQIEGLTTEDFLRYARTKESLRRHLPDEKDWLHIDKKWLCDVLYTLDQDGISRMIEAAVKRRNQHQEEKQDLLIEIRPEFAQALKESESFSHHRGKGAFLLKKSSLKKRSKNDMEEVKEEERELRHNKQEYLQNVKRLKTELANQSDQMARLNHAEAALQNLINEGIIDDQGNPLMNQFNL